MAIQFPNYTHRSIHFYRTPPALADQTKNTGTTHQTGSTISDRPFMQRMIFLLITHQDTLGINMFITIRTVQKQSLKFIIQDKPEKHGDSRQLNNCRTYLVSQWQHSEEIIQTHGIAKPRHQLDLEKGFFLEDPLYWFLHKLDLEKGIISCHVEKTKISYLMDNQFMFETTWG